MSRDTEIPKLLIQQYLLDGGAIDALHETRNVRVRRHVDHPNLALFKYTDDPATDFTDPLVRECRGIVLDEADGWRVVSRAFDKFGNHGESYTAEIDWTTARVQEKLDGSLCVLYHYAGLWRVATSGSPDATGRLQQSGVLGDAAFSEGTFAEYFWSTFRAEGGRLPDPSDLCFAFELMGPNNRVIVVHERPALRLLAVRDRRTGEQFLPDDHADGIGIPPVRSVPLRSVEEIDASYKTMSPVVQEGYVVVDAAFNRAKFKHPGYLALHYLKEQLRPRAFVEMARTGTVHESVVAFPEFMPLLDAARARYSALVERVNAAYVPLAGLATQKEFAAAVVGTPLSAMLFRMRKDGSVEPFLREVHIDKLMGWMGIEERAVET